MKKVVLLSTLMLIFATLQAFSQLQPEIQIRLYNQTVYTDSSNVELQIELTNKGISPISFKLADRRVHNIKLDVRTLANDPVMECDQCIKEFISSQPVYYSEIRLKPEEQFIFIIPLEDFVELKKSGKYFIKAWFFKEFRSTKENPCGSNTIELEITPPELNDEDFKMTMPTAPSKLKPEPIYPDEVIKRTLEARMKALNKKEYQQNESDWDEFFLYLDLEELYLKSGENRKEYLKLSEADRIKKLEEYQKWLKEGSRDKDLLLVPNSYQIIKTSYTNNNAVVVVYEEFNAGRFIDRKQYSYFLRKNDDIWNIYDYSIINMMESPNP